MRRSHFTETQIVRIFKEAFTEIVVGEVCRKQGKSYTTYYKWKSKYGGLNVSDLRRMRELEMENSRLKRT